MTPMLSLLVALSASEPATTSSKAAAGYVGSAVCKKCHEDIYNKFIDSGHPFVLRGGHVARTTSFPLPKGYSWDDVAYVIGGETKKVRYVGLDGHILTASRECSFLEGAAGTVRLAGELPVSIAG